MVDLVVGRGGCGACSGDCGWGKCMLVYLLWWRYCCGGDVGGRGSLCLVGASCCERSRACPACFALCRRQLRHRALSRRASAPLPSRLLELPPTRTVLVSTSSAPLQVRCVTAARVTVRLHRGQAARAPVRSAIRTAQRGACSVPRHQAQSCWASRLRRVWVRCRAMHLLLLSQVLLLLPLLWAFAQ